MRIRSLSFVLIAALSAPAATALTIDNFEEGDFNVVDLATPVTPTLAQQSGLNPANTLGGVRLVRANAEGTLAVATAALVTSGLDDGALLTAVGGSNPDGTFAFIYDGIADNISNGSAGVLNLDLSLFSAISVTASTPIPTGADIRITMWDSTISRSTAFRPLLNGVNTFTIGGGLLALDLTDINAIQIAIQEVGPLTAASILDISAVPVPEPTTALLLSLGLAGLAVARRR